jgi:hypothetical protein
MPVCSVKKARAWYDANGFEKIEHGKSGGAPKRNQKLSAIIKTLANEVQK